MPGSIPSTCLRSCHSRRLTQSCWAGPVPVCPGVQLMISSCFSVTEGEAGWGGPSISSTPQFSTVKLRAVYHTHRVRQGPLCCTRARPLGPRESLPPPKNGKRARLPVASTKAFLSSFLKFYLLFSMCNGGVPTLLSVYVRKYPLLWPERKGILFRGT